MVSGRPAPRTPDAGRLLRRGCFLLNTQRGMARARIPKEHQLDRLKIPTHLGWPLWLVRQRETPGEDRMAWAPVRQRLKYCAGQP